jgi:flagellar biosynthetic protein FliQ
MEALDVVDVTRDALWVLMKISAPIMLVALVVGLAIALLQALTQIQEMTLTFVPKMIAIFFSLIIFMPFIIHQLQDFHAELSERIMAVK